MKACRTETTVKTYRKRSLEFQDFRWDGELMAGFKSDVTDLKFALSRV